jgi:hypothetical protein
LTTLTLEKEHYEEERSVVAKILLDSHSKYTTVKDVVLFRLPTDAIRVIWRTFEQLGLFDEG